MGFDVPLEVLVLCVSHKYIMTNASVCTVCSFDMYTI